jgi:hypothetical protein
LYDSKGLVHQISVLLLFATLGSACGLMLVIVGQGPQGEVVPEKFYDKVAFPVGLLA